MQSFFPVLLLALAGSSPALRTRLPREDAAGKLEPASLREMFQELEELMEDTQLKLQGAARQMESKQGRQSRDLERLSDNDKKFNAQSMERILTIHSWQEMEKVWKGLFLMLSPDQWTLPKSQHWSLFISATLDAESRRLIYNSCSIGKGTELRENVGGKKECIVDEDCKEDHFCQVDILESKCLLRRAQEENCTRDGECYLDHLCIWGQCRATAEKGQTGSICEQQRDCSADLCCALHTYLLFPVCTPLPTKGQPCHDPTHRLFDLVTWELEPEGALDRCPCSKGLMCQPEGKALLSVCKDSDIEQGVFTTDPPQYMEELPFLRLVAMEDPEDGESHTYAMPDMEELWAVDSAAIDSVKGL
ncbi:dickkopf-related protein 3b isoform X1 [Heterodontus francisci]|uniref:dickkopf-related protein 3b isoform X1 n=1 Tax=Heterodontus francisci TaxID=7792 RepID=UPI00355BB694